jgi:hypothetical protein
MAKKRIPSADSVEWLGLCPCGCGTYKAMLLDANDKPIATFGFDEEGWACLMAGIIRQIKGEPMDDLLCEHHTAH